MSKVFNMVGGGGGPAASIFVTGLSETDTVTATKGAKTLNGKWTQKPNPDYVVPDGYTQLEYIESTGTQYINTGIILKQNYIVDLKAYLSAQSATASLFGADDNSSRRFLVLFDANNLMSAIFCADSWTKETTFTPNQFADIRYSLESTQSLTINGVSYGSKNNTVYDATYPMYLFAGNRNGSTICLAKMKCYRFTISLSGSEAINDFIPAKRNSDSAIGLYDIVSGTFFENAGTGEFVAGPEIPQTFDGFLIKPIRDFGTWTVTATDGTNTATQDVLVDVITEYEIEMDLIKPYLYRNGDERESVTGGWNERYVYDSGYTGTHTCTKNYDNIELYLYQYGSNMIVTSNKIQANGTLKVKYDAWSTVETSYTGVVVRFGIFASLPNNQAEFRSGSTFKEYSSAVTDEIASIDVSSDGYVAIGIDSGSRLTKMNIRVKEVWIE